MEKLPKLTRKQAAFVKELVDNPKISASEAAARTYNVATRATAGAVAHENLQKPQVMSHLQRAAEKAELALLSVLETSTSMRKSPAHAGIAASTANSVLDRLYGKATQRVEQTTTAVTISINLSAPKPSVTEGESN